MFTANLSIRFELFSTSHYIVIALFILGSIGLYVYRNKIRHNMRVQKFIKWFLLCMIIASEISFHSWAIVAGVWDKQTFIPIELCSVSTYLAVYVFFTKSKKAFNVLYFIGVLPPALAVFTPDLIYGFPHFLFIRFFIQHMAIVWSVLFFIFIYGYRPQFSDVFRTFLYLNIFAVPVYFINRSIGSNYMYLESAPESRTPLGWLGEGPLYLINLEILAFVLFILLYVPFAINNRKTKRG